jgi:hypothetical protein
MNSVNHNRFIIVDTKRCPLTGIPTTIYQEGGDAIFDHYTEQTGPIRYTDFVSMAFDNLNDYQKKVVVDDNKINQPELITMDYLTSILGPGFDRREG